MQPFSAALFDENNPVSIGNKLPAEYLELFKNCLGHIDDTELGMTVKEDALLKHLAAAYNFRPLPSDNRIRFLFWQEYEYAIFENRKIDFTKVHGPLLTPEMFKKIYTTNPGCALFLLCRPPSYRTAVQEALVTGMDRLRTILDMDPIEPNGKINTRLLDLQVKIVAMLDLRVNGAPTQKIHNVNQFLPGQIGPNGEALPGNGGSLTGAQAIQTINNMIRAGDMEGIQKRLQELEEAKMKAKGIAIPNLRHTNSEDAPNVSHNKYKEEPYPLEVEVNGGEEGAKATEAERLKQNIAAKLSRVPRAKHTRP